MSGSPIKRAHLGLQWKLTLAFVLVVMAPLGASYLLIDQIGQVAANFAAGEADTHVAAMDRALGAYRELFDTTKRLHAEIADRLSRHFTHVASPSDADLEQTLDDEAAKEGTLRALALLRPDGTVAARAEHSLAEGYRDKVVDQSVGTSGASLRLTFAVPANLQDEYGFLKKQVDAARQVVAQYRVALSGGYRTAFLVVMALAALAAIGIGVLMSTLVTRRIAALVGTARRVSDGQLDARVALRGNDEMAELGSAFNTMLDDLAHTRSQIEYLQRIGAWQDVARRLAHEIKNPLTPIQLAVQQTVSSYKGDDPRFAKLLADTGEIVEEEIAGLRRLVDTFRTLGQLPKVSTAPLALAEVLDELRLDPTFASRLELAPPGSPVTLHADKLLLKRVLANLVENGIHAGQEAGRDGTVVVAWDAEPGGDRVTITVDDQGKGVAEADRERIFEPYVTSKATGTGLGLAISRKIALEHGGELSVAPAPAPTGGARFVVTLPLRAPEAPEAVA